MERKDQKMFELDEPAARSHTPAGWPIQVIEIQTSGKAPKKYGPTTYRFGAPMTLSVILPRRGWTLVKKTKNYIYLTPPADQIAPPFQISIAVPTPAQCLELAFRNYARGQSWMGQLGEWPAWYLHERNTDMQEMWRDPATGDLASRLHKNPPESSLSIGEWGAWNFRVAGVAGKFSLGGLAPSADVSHEKSASAADSTFLEGAFLAVELTVHERNASARRLCIEHYGLNCQACGMSYEDKYGAIGAELIHVHHVTPLAAIGGEYRVDPVRDLIPLCASCHQLAHRRSPPYSAAEIKYAIEQHAIRS
ncbi:HNH endonuclease [Paraburkholderia sp. BCC1885]|uniref:HNH endonuclease n=1 Tax=Paraburkholderia sp. BCC1885 TaxID=2562669 RepID=UPI00118361D8|nr:HNH endonuclease [Paraburkholderia sp. BCC1885]